MANEEVCNRIQKATGVHVDLRYGHSDGMAASQDPLAWRIQFCRGQGKEKEGEEGRKRVVKITSRNGQELSLEIP